MMDPDLVDCIRQGRKLSAQELMQVEVFRTRMNIDLMKVFEQYEALICPTNAIVAPLLTDDISIYEADLANGKMQAFDMAHPFNMVPNLPVISLPVGLTPDHMPVGMQLVGRPHANEQTLALAGGVEALLDPLPNPPVFPV